MKRIPSICESFPISNDEYAALDHAYGRLAKKAAWELLKKNTHNNHTDDFDDVNQEIMMAISRAGSYYKRQTYIENCFAAAKAHVTDGFLVSILQELETLWQNRTRHGANRQKYGPYQERILEKLVRRAVPRAARPNREAVLYIDTKFATYCKAIAWNAQKSMGRKITREKAIRTGMVDISTFDYITGV